jgi:protein-S-isoprenylcysteine O-methyltransferase Ste14
MPILQLARIPPGANAHQLEGLEDSRTMHGEYDRSLAPRLFSIALHLAAAVFVGWLLVGGGLESINAWRGKDWPLALPLRRWLLFGCALVYFLRVVVTTFYLLKRKMGWGEAVLIGVFVSAVHILFAYLGGTDAHRLGPVAVVAVLLYVLGSYLNTGSELQRKWWKERPENKGRLYTGGLFQYSQHVNYFGDALLFTGYALVTGSAWALLVPLVMIAGFVFFNIPELDGHLRTHYGAEFEQYARRTRKFVPYVY